MTNAQVITASAEPRIGWRNEGDDAMNTITTKDGTQIYYNDWGKGQPVVFSHGWTLSSEAFEDRMFFRASHGYRCIAHDRRGHERSSHPGTATIWIPMPMTSPYWLNNSTGRTRRLRFTTTPRTAWARPMRTRSTPICSRSSSAPIRLPRDERLACPAVPVPREVSNVSAGFRSVRKRARHGPGAPQGNPVPGAGRTYR